MEHRGIELDSKEELHICWYLDELEEAGYIKWYKKAQVYTLFEGYKPLKLREHCYQPDFEFEWTEEGSKLLPSYGCLWEVKGPFDFQNMTRLFKLNQKWMFDKGVYVQLITPQKLFTDTFAPQRYLLTDKGKGVRKVRETYRTLNEYIQQQSEQTHRETIQRSKKG